MWKIDDSEAVQTARRAKKLLDKLAEYKPLAKIEELEEQNYNMIDNVLNNGAEKKEQEQTKGRISIKEKLAEKKAVKQLTRDHTLVQNLLDRGQISQQEALNHPKKHYITRAIGVGDTLDIDYQMYELKKESIVLLCTDGLSNYLEIEKLPELLKNCIRKESLADLIDFANDQGGSDNITAVMLYRK